MTARGRGRASRAPHWFMEAKAPSKAPSGARAASMVGLGILLSRLMGLVRETVFAHFFGSSPAADAVKAAYRIPNLLQNLFGEGALSASFIPVYAGLLARGERRDELVNRGHRAWVRRRRGSR